MRESYQKIRPDAPVKIEVFNFPTFKTCGHTRATLRNVQVPGGCAVYLCRQCYCALAAFETRAVGVKGVRGELDDLFNGRPLGSLPGAFSATEKGGAVL